MEIKIKFFSWSGAFSVVGRGSMLTNYFFFIWPKPQIAQASYHCINVHGKFEITWVFSYISRF